jgi:hypothetical protein
MSDEQDPPNADDTDEQVGPTADPIALSKQKKDLARGRRREIDDLKKILELPHGRRLLLRLLAHAGIMRTSFAGEAPLAMAFAEGRRHEGLFLLSEIDEADPERYLEMLREGKR